MEFVVRCNVATSFLTHPTWVQFITQHQLSTARHLPLLLLPLATVPMSRTLPTPTPPPPPPPPTFSSLFSHRPWRRFDETLRARRHHRRRRRRVDDSTTSFAVEIVPPRRRRPLPPRSTSTTREVSFTRAWFSLDKDARRRGRRLHDAMRPAFLAPG